jgi:hypothetical protein
LADADSGGKSGAGVAKGIIGAFTKSDSGGSGGSSSSSGGSGKKQSIEDRLDAMLPDLPNLHKGGKVKRSGVFRLKRGERVLTAKQDTKRGRSKR